MPFVQERIADIATNSKTLIPAGSGLLILGGTAIKYMANAGQNERLIKMHRSKSTHQEDSRRMKTVITRNKETGVFTEEIVPQHREGEMYGIVKRGWRVGFPFIRSYRKVSLTQTNSNLDEFNVMMWQDDKSLPRKKWAMKTNINFAIIDEPYAMNRATFDFESKNEHKQTVANLCSSGLRKITANMPEWALNDEEVLTAGLQAVRGPQLRDLTGVELRSLQFNNFTKSDSQVMADGDGDTRPLALKEVGRTDLNLDTAASLHAV